MGREDAKGEVASRLQATRLVTIVGPGGAGKTRLALEVAAELDKAGQRVAFVDLAVLSEPESVLAVVAKATGVTGESYSSLLDAMAGQLGEGRLVVVLDNCEHLRAGCAEVAEAVLGACGGLRILATSRERLGTAGEVVWRIPPLSLPEAGPVLPQALVESEAVQLFCERAAALSPGFVPTPDDVEAIVEICRRLDGNALAIELAAARVVALPPAQIAARLHDRFALVQAGPSTAPARQRSLRGALEWSYQLLALPEQVLLRRLSVFPASFGLDGAEAVCSGDDVEPRQVLALLTSLVEKSLVVSEAAGCAARFRLLETVRAYAGERLEEVERTEELAQRHAAWCLTLVQSDPGEHASARTWGHWIERLDDEQDNLRSALEWALAAGHAELALGLARGRMRLWEHRGCYGEARQCLERVLAATEAASEPLRAAVLHDAGFAALVVGDLDTARAHLHASLALADKVADRRAFVRTRALLASASTFGDDDACVEVLEHEAQEIRAGGDDALLAEVLVACGQARMHRGEPSLARRHFEESLHAARRANYGPLSAKSLVGLGSAELCQGDYPAAEAHLHEGIDVAAACSDIPTEVVTRSWLAELAHLRGSQEAAHSCFEQCLDAARATGAPYPVARSLLGLGRAILEQGDPHGAQPLFDEAAQVARRAGLAHLVARGLIGKGQAALAQQNLAGGRAHLDDALLVARRHGDKVAEALALEGLGRLGRLEGDVEAAASRARQALALQTQIGDPAATANCLELLASLFAVEEGRSVAARLLAAADSMRGRHGCARPASQQQEHSSTVEMVRRALGQGPFQTEWDQGTALSTRAAGTLAQQERSPRMPRPSAGWEALTGAERTVAELAAQGRTNAEIAHQLRIAPATVKAHLRRVFAKVSVQTRASLAAEMHRGPER